MKVFYKNNNKGSALIVVLIFFTVIFVIISGVIELTISSLNQSQASVKKNEISYSGESALEVFLFYLNIAADDANTKAFNYYFTSDGKLKDAFIGQFNDSNALIQAYNNKFYYYISNFLNNKNDSAEIILNNGNVIKSFNELENYIKSVVFNIDNIALINLTSSDLQLKVVSKESTTNTKRILYCDVAFNPQVMSISTITSNTFDDLDYSIFRGFDYVVFNKGNLTTGNNSSITDGNIYNAGQLIINGKSNSNEKNPHESGYDVYVNNIVVKGNNSNIILNGSSMNVNNLLYSGSSITLNSKDSFIYAKKIYTNGDIIVNNNTEIGTLNGNVINFIRCNKLIINSGGIVEAKEVWFDNINPIDGILRVTEKPVYFKNGFTVNSNGVLNVASSVINNGSVSINGTVTIGGSFISHGSITINSGARLIVGGSIYIDGSITINSGATVDIGDSMYLYGSMTINNQQITIKNLFDYYGSISNSALNKINCPQKVVDSLVYNKIPSFSYPYTKPILIDKIENFDFFNQLLDANKINSDNNAKKLPSIIQYYNNNYSFSNRNDTFNGVIIGNNGLDLGQNLNVVYNNSLRSYNNIYFFDRSSTVLEQSQSNNNSYSFIINNISKQKIIKVLQRHMIIE